MGLFKMKEISYQKIITLENIEDAYYIIRKNTKHRQKLLNYEMFYLSNIVHIKWVLEMKKYKHDAYNIFLIQEPKYRIIMSERLKDKIVNHLISKYALLPVIELKLISTNVATRKNKGTKAAVMYFKKYVEELKNKYDKIYVLKCDIKKYFYTIDHNILFNKVKKLLQDEDILAIVKDIIDSTDVLEVNEEIKKNINREILRLKANKNVDMKRIKELESMPLYKKGKGLPIGNMSSQLLAILYLNDLDHFIKEKLHVKQYIRYMDDFLLFHYDREYLKKCLMQIYLFLQKEELELNKKTQIYDLSKGVNFLGYRFILKGQKLYQLMSGQNKRKISRKLNRLKKRNSKHYEPVKASYKGYFMHCKSKGFLDKHKWYS